MHSNLYCTVIYTYSCTCYQVVEISEDNFRGYSRSLDTQLFQDLCQQTPRNRCLVGIWLIYLVGIANPYPQSWLYFRTLQLFSSLDSP